MVKLKIVEKNSNDSLSKLYDKLHNDYKDKFKQYLGELKMYTTESDCEIIQSEFFIDLLKGKDIEYTSVYFIFDSRIPFHILEKDNGNLIVVDEYFEDILDHKEVSDIVEFKNIEETYKYINDTYKEFLDKQFNILDKYYKV